LKDLKEDISCLEILDYVNLDENTYILNVNDKLTKLHIFTKQTPRNIKLMCLVHICSFMVSKYRYSIYSKPVWKCNILWIIYDKNR
jgi:hypothetical protein